MAAGAATAYIEWPTLEIILARVIKQVKCENISICLAAALKNNLRKTAPGHLVNIVFNLGLSDTCRANLIH